VEQLILKTVKCYVRHTIEQKEIDSKRSVNSPNMRTHNQQEEMQEDSPHTRSISGI